MKIYLKSREKVPIFPVQWVILETKEKIPKIVQKEVKTELIFRNRVRKEFSKHYMEPEDYEEEMKVVKDDETKNE